MNATGLGASVKRKEDIRFIAGKGRYVDDINRPGQVRGGIAQGMPRADSAPSFDVDAIQTPCPSNPLGVKGCGEAGCTGALPAVMNALLDALAPLGISRLDMPATPETVWRAIRAAATSAAP